MMATSNQAEDDDEAKIQEPRGEPSSSSFVQVMTAYGKEFCFILAVIFTAFAALQNGPLKTRKADPPERFFPTPSLVTDFYLGNIKALLSLLIDKDVAFVMYYAPWDATSINAQKEFESVARYYHSQVYFAAVNCWWPEGECQHKYKLHSYPVLIAHVNKVGGIKYNGPLMSNYIISFLDHILNPIAPLHHLGDLLDLQTKHEGVLVGFFDFHDSAQPPGYLQYYIASLKALVQDPSQKVGFAVITSRKAAVKFKMHTSPSVTLHLWNTSEIYSGKALRAENIILWAYGKLTQVSRWLNPFGTKSQLLSQIVEKSPILLLFTPRNMMLGCSPYYDLLREVAMDYYNCNASAYVTALIHRTVLKRHILQEEFFNLVKKCSVGYKTWSGGKEYRTARIAAQYPCCQSLSLSDIAEHSLKNCACTACLHYVSDPLVSNPNILDCEKHLVKVLKHLQVINLKAFQQCDDIELSHTVKYESFDNLVISCHAEDKEFLKPKETKATSDFSGVQDERVVSMVKQLDKIQCRHLNIALNYSDLLFPSIPLSQTQIVWQANFTGLGCRTNKTLVFVAMDAIQFYSFAESLGVDVSKELHQTFIVVLEAQQESQYLLTGGINKRNLVEFIKNYTAGSLDRHLRMAVRKQSVCDQSESNDTVCVQEVTTETFREIVLDNDKDVVIMYYAPWCGFCTGVAHVFLTVARYFSEIDGIIFTRINGDDNDLPWEYTVEKYPALLLFPARKKSESVEFPPHMPITSTNLLHFILVHAQTKVRWKTAMQLCDKHCTIRNLLQSSSELQHLFHDLHLHLNHIHFVHKQIHDSKKEDTVFKFKKSKSLFKEEVTETQLLMLKEYYKHLVDIIRDKKKKIRQAWYLQDLLRKKISTLNRNKQTSQNKSSEEDDVISVKIKSKRFKPDIYSKVSKNTKDKAVDILKTKHDKDEL